MPGSFHLSVSILWLIHRHTSLKKGRPKFGTSKALFDAVKIIEIYEVGVMYKIDVRARRFGNPHCHVFFLDKLPAYHATPTIKTRPISHQEHSSRFKILTPSSHPSLAPFESLSYSESAWLPQSKKKLALYGKLAH